MTKSYLEILGEQSLNSTDISSTNYQEFNDIENSLVKKVNANNDEFVRTVEQQSEQLVNWYNTAIGQGERNVTALSNIAQYSKSLKKSVEDFNTWRDNEKSFNEYRKRMEKGEPDPNITEQDAWEFKLALLEREGRLVENVLNEENEGFEAINARTIGGFTLEHIDSVQEAKQFKDRWYPIYRESASSHKFYLPDGRQMSLNEATNPEDYLFISAQIDKLAILEFRKLGYKEGFIRKYVMRPMYDLEEDRFKEWKTETVAGIKAGVQLTEARGLINSLETDPTAIVMNIENLELNKLDTPLAKQKTLAPLLVAAENGLIDVEFVRNKVGNILITPRDGGKKVPLKDYWKEFYLPLENAAIKYQAEKLRAAKILNDAKEAAFVDGKLQGYKDNPSSFSVSNVQDDITEFKSLHPGRPVPSRLNDALTAAEYPESSDYENIIRSKAQDGIRVTQEELNRTSPEFQRRYKDSVEFQGDKNLKRLGINSYVGETLSWAAPGAIPGGILEYNILRKAEKAYDAAFEEEMLRTRGGNLSKDKRIDMAHATGLSKVEDKMEEIFCLKEDWEDKFDNNEARAAFIENLRKPDGGYAGELSQMRTDIENINNGIKNNTLDVQQSTPFEGELLHLNESIKAIKSGGAVPDFYRQISKGLKIAPYDLMLARLEATCMLEQLIEDGYEVSFTSEPGEWSYKVGPGHTLRLMQSGTNLEKQKNLAEAMGVLAKANNLDKGGYSAVLDSTGNQIELETPLEQHTIEELVGILNDNPGATFGMYNITAQQLKDLLLDKESILDADDIFDQDFQDALIFDSLRYQQQQHLSQGSTDTTWLYDIKYNKQDIKELEDILPLLKDHPFAHIATLLPDVASAFISQNSATINK